MANQRGTFAKRNREMKLKDRAKEKVERRNAAAARKADQPGTKGPQIAWDERGGTENTSITEGDPAPVTPGPSSSSTTSSSSPAPNTKPDT